MKTCENPGCTHQFVLTPAAPHKKFCSLKCKNEWHGRERDQIRQALRERRLAAVQRDLQALGHPLKAKDR
jgi:predicted RNA-binding Zn ribbon-like protein